MTQKTVIKKVEGGKLFRLDFEYSDKIDEMKITGDFFLHPENTIEKMDECLVGTSVDSNIEEMREKLESVISENNAELFGVSPADIAIAIFGVFNDEV